MGVRYIDNYSYSFECSGLWSDSIRSLKMTKPFPDLAGVIDSLGCRVMFLGLTAKHLGMFSILSKLKSQSLP